MHIAYKFLHRKFLEMANGNSTTKNYITMYNDKHFIHIKNRMHIQYKNLFSFRVFWSCDKLGNRRQQKRRPISNILSGILFRSCFRNISISHNIHTAHT